MVQNIKKGIFALLALTLLLAGCKSKEVMQSREETPDLSSIIAVLPAV